MIPDSGSFVDLIGSMVVGAFGGDMILLGIIFLMVVGFVLLKANVKASSVLGIGASIIFCFALLTAEFSVVLWWIIVVVLVVLVVYVIRLVWSQQ